jgi:nucleoside phosphorylase
MSFRAECHGGQAASVALPEEYESADACRARFHFGGCRRQQRGHQGRIGTLDGKTPAIAQRESDFPTAIVVEALVGTVGFAGMANGTGLLMKYLLFSALPAERARMIARGRWNSVTCRQQQIGGEVKQ